MKTILIFILLIYWSIMLFAPAMSKNDKMSLTKVNQIMLLNQKPNI